MTDKVQAAILGLPEHAWVDAVDAAGRAASGGSVRTPIRGGPQPLNPSSGQRRAHPNYTLVCEGPDNLLVGAVLIDMHDEWIAEDHLKAHHPTGLCIPSA